MKTLITTTRISSPHLNRWVVILVWLILWWLGGLLPAQLPAHYGQYMFNSMVLNPAYCGSRDALNTSLLFRGQWMGVPGAPRTITASAHAPLRNTRNNFGGLIMDDRLGITQQQWVMGAYAYRFLLGTNGQARMSLGIQGGVSLHQFSYAELYLEQPADENFPATTPTLAIPRFGFGAWFDLPRFYAGFSMPELLKVRTQAYQQYVPGRLDYPHTFLTVGSLFPLRPDLDFKPSILLKYKPTTPLQVDLNAHFLYRDQFGAALSYRSGDALMGMLEFWPVPQFRIGYGYEYALNALSAWTRLPGGWGTHEFLLSYEFKYLIKAGGTRNF